MAYYFVGVMRRTFALAVAVLVARVPAQGCPFRWWQLRQNILRVYDLVNNPEIHIEILDIGLCE